MWLETAVNTFVFLKVMDPWKEGTKQDPWEERREEHGKHHDSQGRSLRCAGGCKALRPEGLTSIWPLGGWQ